jgi:hypothetical protein
MKARAALLAGLAGGALLLSASTVAAQQRARARGVMVLDYAEAGVDFDGHWLDYEPSEGQRRLTYREWVRIELAGQILDPRIVNYRLAIRPAFAQEKSAEENDDIDSDQIGIDGVVNFLSSEPVSLTLSALRADGTTSGEFGTLSDFSTRQFNAQLRWRNRYLPADLEYIDFTRDNLWSPATQDVVFRLNEEIETIRLTAQNSKTGIMVERMTLDDRETDRDFTANRVDFNHSLRWGKGSHLSSQVDYLDREGNFPYERLTWTERLRIQHTWKLRSDTRYRFLSLDTSGSSIDANSGSFSMDYRVTPSLSFGGLAFARRSDFSTGREEGYGAGPQIAYNVALSPNMTLSTSAAASFEILDREATDGVVPVVGEEHVVDASGRFLLDNPNPESIVVSNSDRTIEFIEGADYRLVQIDGLAEVVVLPGGRILEGDLLLVDYVFVITPDEQFDIIVASYSVGLTRGGFQIFDRRSLREGDIVEGTGLGLVEFDDHVTGARYNRSSGRTTLQLLAERRDYESNGFAALTYRGRGTATRAINPKMNAALSVSGSRTEAEGLRNYLVSIDPTLRWTPTRALHVLARGTAWFWNQNNSPRETFVGGSVGVEYRVGKVEVMARYEHNRSDFDITRVENRFMARLVRRL